jgi:hypothetical protein
VQSDLPADNQGSFIEDLHCSARQASTMQNGDIEGQPFDFETPIKSIAIIGAGMSFSSRISLKFRIIWDCTGQSRTRRRLHLDNDL